MLVRLDIKSDVFSEVTDEFTAVGIDSESTRALRIADLKSRFHRRGPAVKLV